MSPWFVYTIRLFFDNVFLPKVRSSGGQKRQATIQRHG